MSKAFASLLARRFAPLDFSSVPGFPHPVPDMSEWGDFLPVFREEKDDNPAEHLLKFHECMELLNLQHEDVRMKMFMYSLYGDARKWYFSLPSSSISSLKDFHKAFNQRCKKFFPDELLFDNCCEEFNLHNKAEDEKREGSLHHLSNDLHDIVPSHQDEPQTDDKGTEDSSINNTSDFHQSEEFVSLVIHHKDHFPSEVYEGLVTSESSIVHQRDDQKCMHVVVNDLHEEYAAEVNTIHHDQEISDSPHDNLSDAFDIISNASTVVSCDEDHIFSSENCEDVEQIDKFASDSFRSAEIEEDSLQFPDLQGLSNLQLENENHDQECVESAAHVMGSPHFSDLQTKANCSTYEESDGGEELNSPDQQSIVYVSPTNLEQPAFNNVISKGSFQHLFNLQLEQQFKEVFLSDIYDPVDNYFQSMSSKCVKAFWSEEDCPYHLFKPLCYMIWLPLLFGSRSRKLSVNHLLTWLHWKHDFT
jgi:hypothetical protein